MYFGFFERQTIDFAKRVARCARASQHYNVDNGLVIRRLSELSEEMKQLKHIYMLIDMIEKIPELKLSTNSWKTQTAAQRANNLIVSNRVRDQVMLPTYYVVRNAIASEMYHATRR